MRVSMALAVIPRAVLVVLTLVLATALAAAGYVATQPSPLPLPPLTGQAGNGLIAYDAGADIWVMQPDGSDRRNLTADGRYDLEPTWSPDGRWIAFWSHRATEGPLSSNDGSSIMGPASLVVIDADGVAGNADRRRSGAAGW